MARLLRSAAGFKRLVPETVVRAVAAELPALMDEQTVGATLGGAPNAISVDEGVHTESSIMLSMWLRAEAGLAAALREKEASVVREFLLARARSVLKKMVDKLPEDKDV